MPPRTPEVALCPVELSNVALRMAPRMHQNMQLETQKLLKKFLGGAVTQVNAPRVKVREMLHREGRLSTCEVRRPAPAGYLLPAAVTLTRFTLTVL